MVEKRRASEEAESNKKAKVGGHFGLDFSDDESKQQLRESIENSAPYKHGVIRPLLDDTLLRDVRKEILAELHFTRKETDIYKVNQTGDLANLSGLDSDELQRLSSVAKLRDALYSKQFREYLSFVAQSGPLSGSKQDLSINLYDKGCHLLNHDDVIGSRRISYILYLTDPDEPWQPKWGGGLRLYPTVVPNIPEADWSLVIPPAWNQLSFFTVQPGLSFHDVEEVFFDKTRLSISGWFHIPQPGEEGFIEGEQEATEARSSLTQLQSSELLEYDFPKKVYAPYEELEDLVLGDEDREYLKRYLNPSLVDADHLVKLNEKFCEESMIEIADFFNDDFATKLKNLIDADDISPKMPKTSAEVASPWKLARPPHKMRYLYIDDAESVPATEHNQAHVGLTEVQQVFKHQAFRKWLKALSSLTPTASQVLARRFRPGYDFTLATAHESKDPVLEGCLSLTPSKGWDDGELGGYDLCMSVEDDGDDDPAVYKATGGEEDDPVMFTNQANWNVFHLIVRDQGLLRFIKYVSKTAPGSRYDVSAEWKVDVEEDEDEDEDEEEEEEEE